MLVLNCQKMLVLNCHFLLESTCRLHHAYVSNDRTDYNTLIPVIKKHINAFGKVPKEVTADSGYCSEKIYCF